MPFSLLRRNCGYKRGTASLMILVWRMAAQVWFELHFYVERPSDVFFVAWLLTPDVALPSNENKISYAFRR